MGDLQHLGSSNEPDDGIEDAEFEEIVDGGRLPPPPSDRSPLPEPNGRSWSFAAWLRETPPGDLALAVVLIGLAVFLFGFLMSRIAGPVSHTDTALEQASAAPPSRPLITDLAQTIDPSLGPGSKFQIDTDSAAPAGADQRCNRKTTYQYYFNQERAGTYVSWFNDPQTPRTAAGESGTYRFQGSTLYLKPKRFTVTTMHEDGSVTTMDVPDKSLPPEISADVAVEANGIVDIGGAKFRRCNGYF